MKSCAAAYVATLPVLLQRMHAARYELSCEIHPPPDTAIDCGWLILQTVQYPMQPVSCLSITCVLKAEMRNNQHTDILIHFFEQRLVWADPFLASSTCITCILAFEQDPASNLADTHKQDPIMSQ